MINAKNGLENELYEVRHMLNHQIKKAKRYEKALEHYAKPRGWTKDAYGDWKSYLDESIIAIEALEDKE